ncbi:hypothetical protein ACTXT7_005391 [Hymenolepis weldensis]
MTIDLHVFNGPNRCGSISCPYPTFSHPYIVTVFVLPLSTSSRLSNRTSTDTYSMTSGTVTECLTKETKQTASLSVAYLAFTSILMYANLDAQPSSPS